jgi:hypothetical protein
MDDDIKQLFEGILRIEEVTDYHYREVCGFTFVFKRVDLFINDEISTCEIKPIAIIYEENGEYYLSHIDVIDEIEAVVKGYVEEILK